METKPDRVHPFSKEKQMGPEAFVSAVRQIIANQYQERAYKEYSQNAYNNALKYYEAALQYDPQNAYTCGAIGIVYHAIFAEKGKVEFMKKAEDFYERALKIDPDHETAKEGLKRLQQHKTP
jgi:tetratricopeptide (TPR) repeat protein